MDKNMKNIILDEQDRKILSILQEDAVAPVEPREAVIRGEGQHLQ